LDFEHSDRFHQRPPPWLAQRLAHGCAERVAGALLRLAKATRNRLHLAGGRRPYMHSAVRWALCLAEGNARAALFTVGDAASHGRNPRPLPVRPPVRPTSPVHGPGSDGRLWIFPLPRSAPLSAPVL